MSEDYRKGYKDGFDDGYEKGRQEAVKQYDPYKLWPNPTMSVGNKTEYRAVSFGPTMFDNGHDGDSGC